jgi:hypothetical protein
MRGQRVGEMLFFLGEVFYFARLIYGTFARVS